MEQNVKQANVHPLTRQLTICALLAALGTVLGILSIPLPAVSAAGYSLKIGITVLLCYMAQPMGALWVWWWICCPPCYSPRDLGSLGLP